MNIIEYWITFEYLKHMNTHASFHTYITDDKHSLTKILAWLILIYLEKLFIYYIEKYLFDVVFQSVVKCVNTVSSTGYQQFHTFFFCWQCTCPPLSPVLLLNLTSHALSNLNTFSYWALTCDDAQIKYFTYNELTVLLICSFGVTKNYMFKITIQWWMWHQ